MIASIRGSVVDIALDHTVLEAAGVGYRVNATPATLATLHRGERSDPPDDHDRARGFADAVRIPRQGVA